jgi:hypothetical protein
MDTWIWVALAIVAVVVVLVAVLMLTSSSRRRGLRRDFGPEYDRTLESAESRRGAESELRERVRRHDEFELRDLDRDERSRFLRAWEECQAHFVDAPQDAIGEADDLIRQAMRARGYPVDDFDQRAADLSVDHPSVVEHYRNAHQTAGRARSGEATTEELRRAMVHYRTLFDELVGVGDATRTETRS